MKKLSLVTGGALLALLCATGIANAVTRDPVLDAVAVRPATGTAPFPVTPTATKLLVQEVLVVSSGVGTMVPASPMVGRLGIEIQNRGPNSIFCKQTSGAALNTTREIKGGGDSWGLDVTESVTINCKAATADQVSGAATVVTEVGR